jgi:hypothetical protein
VICIVTFTGGSDVTGFDAVRVGRGMPRAPVPFCGCGGTPHGRGSFCGAYGVRGSAVRARKRDSKTNRIRNKGAFIHTMYKKRGVGTWWRRNLSGTVSVTWRSAPGGCRRRARLVLTVVPVGPGRCWLFLLRSEGKEGERERDGRGSLAMGGNGPGKRRKREGRGSLAMGGNGPGKRRKRESRGSLTMGGNGPATRRKRESRGSLTMGGNGPGKQRKRVVD